MTQTTPVPISARSCHGEAEGEAGSASASASAPASEFLPASAPASASAPEGDGLTPLFSHERLDVYQTALHFVVLADDVASTASRGRGYLADQLRRAATSTPLNIAEGAGEFSRRDKARFYRIARRSAAECAAILDVCRHLNLAAEHNITNGKELLNRIAAMLTRLANIHTKGKSIT
jgi:four helix bundle protein